MMPLDRRTVPSDEGFCGAGHATLSEMPPSAHASGVAELARVNLDVGGGGLADAYAQTPLSIPASVVAFPTGGGVDLSEGIGAPVQQLAEHASLRRFWLKWAVRSSRGVALVARIGLRTYALSRFPGSRYDSCGLVRFVRPCLCENMTLREGP